jgi:prevent-host-death family protein
MITIKPSSELQSNYDEIVKICREYNEPVFITENGYGDTVLLSIERYSQLVGKQDLYRLIDEGLDAEHNGQVVPYKEAVASIREKIEAYYL